uniref:Ras-responsive element-binding protein 1 n=1 Tax=Labrus bergylta TaxID=56723 RepID=A0A3Q3FEE6_9LABR
GGGGGIMGAEGGGDLSSINAMMSAVMSAAGTINGGGDGEGGNESSAFICPLCDKNCQSQHQLTMHIRQHNADAGASDHSCSICGKCLSSASSLDRHMLVHSGERPYKCNVCGQTFTTNGNMHRHMKIHEKDPASGLLPVSPPSPTKRRRPSVKRRLEEENGEEPPNKKVVEDAASEELAAAVRGAEEELLPCPICFKTCSSRLELDAHMDAHPDTALRCDICCLSFRTHRGMLRHNAGVHKLLPQDPSGRPFIQNNPSIPTGFNDLAFIDFSCKKFAHIAQVWCETNLRRCISKFHRFVCDCCDKAFPLHSALELHKITSHSEKANDADTQEKEVLHAEQSGFLEGLGLQHISTVIHVEPPSFSLPQEPASAYLSGGLGLTLGLGVGGLAALSIPLLEASGSASTLQGLTQRDALSLLSLQPFPTGLLLQPEGGAATGSAVSSGAKPGEAGGAGIMELADIQQILQVASAAPNQMGLTLPPLAKAPGFAGSLVQGQKAMPPLKPKPPITPRSSLTANTPPPLQSSQQASLGCISPSLPPPTPTLFKTPSSSAGNGGQLDAECMGDAHTPLSDSPPAVTTAVHEEAGLSGRKPGTKAGNNAGSAKGSFPCRFCDQVFSFSGVLQAHMRFHLGILPHQCNICDYVAPDKATLIRHLRTHSGERPYVCRVCHYPFTVKANCERHLRKKHAKTSRKDIEKNIKYVTSTTTANIAAAITTTCRFCGEDLKSYRALQIHLRTHNGCQRKPFECRRCGAAFLAKRNCIHHLLKQHPEVQEREIEDHIATLLPATQSASAAGPVPAAAVAKLSLNGISPPAVQALQAVKVEDVVYPAELDQPLDFSAKGRSSQAGSPGVKLESVSPTFDCSAIDQPIDLSIPSKRQRREAAGVERREIKMEQGGNSIEQPILSKEEKTGIALPPLHPHPQLGCYQLPPGSTPPPASLPNISNSTRAQRLKPLLPKPSSSTTTTTSSPSSTTHKELPPLASIAQIIHSVSGVPDLLKREDGKPQGGVSSQGESAAAAPGASAAPETQSEDTTEGSMKEKAAVSSSGIDLESSGEFASVEKMLATTDANKFSTYLQTGAADLGEKEEGKPVAAVGPQSKGKKNAYSNSVQKMTCPFCPRVFPWASSLQRHMLTHTDDDDCHSNKSLDLNFGKKLIDFKLSTSPDAQQQEYKHVCRVCNKSFRYATTLARHERAHLSEETPTPAPVEVTSQETEEATESTVAKPTEDKEEEKEEEQKETEMEEEEGGVMRGGKSEGGESGESEEEKEERSEEEASEPKSLEGGRVDKRKKICKVCDKRFWSLQDLTRHTRSHTGERPYQCQTCERTFTLKHSLVRHQRIHLKPRGADGVDGASVGNDDASEDGDSCGPTPTSTCPPSENESECGSGPIGAKELDEEEDVKEEVEEGGESAVAEEENSVKKVESAADPEPPTTNTSPEEKSKLPEELATQKPSEDSTPKQQATDTKTSDESSASDLKSTPESNTSKDPSPSSSMSPEESAPADGLIQGLLEIHAKPALEHILPNGEPPLVGAD